MFEGMLNKDIDKDISVGLYQLYQPSTKGARLEGSSIPLSPINKWSDSGGDLDSVELHMTRAQICQVEASLTNEGNLKYDLGAAGCHLLGCIFNNSVVIDIRPEAIDTYKMVTKIPCLGSTHQLPAWSHGISSPGENEQQLELYRMSDTQWDPGLCAQDYKYRIDVDFDEHRTIRRPLEKALMLQIQHLSANGTERTIVLTEIRLSWAPYVIRWCTVLEYRVFKYQKLCKLYKFKRDETSHGEDILHASVLNEFLTWMVWRCISQSDANCAADLVLENMIFGVLIIGTLCAGKRCFSLLINDSICISVLHLDGPWDPGIFHAVAWGQATFCGGGNDICQRMLQLSCKMETHATVLGANDVLQYISACSLFLQLGRRKLYRVLSSGDDSSQFLKPGIYITNQMFGEILDQFFCSKAQGFATEELYKILYQVNELLLFPDQKIGRPWCDTDLICKLILSRRGNGFSPSKCLLQLKPYIVRQWDPGISGIFSHQDTIHGHAVAWGQATFCGGGNVTPMNSKVSHPKISNFRLCIGNTK
jgi:hypothetical protein